MMSLSPFALRRSACRSCMALLLLLPSTAGLAVGRCDAPSALIAKTRPGTVIAYQNLGRWFEAKGQFECAAEVYHRQVSLAPKSANAHLFLGRALQASGMRDEAALELNHAVDLDPSSKAARLALGALEHDRGNQAEALSQWQEVIHLDPESVTALDWIAKTRIEAHQYTAALDLLASAPDSEDLVVDRVIASSKAAFFEEAIDVGMKAIEKHPDWLRLRMAVATILVQRNRFQEAVALLETAIRGQPNDLDLKTLFLRVLVLMGDMSKSKPYAADFLEHHPGNFDGLYLNGLLERQDGDYDAALLHLKAAEAMQPDHFDVHFNVGATLAKLHRNEEAKAELEEAMALDDSGADVHFQLAGVLRSLPDAAGAKKQMGIYQERLRSRALHDQTVSLAAQAAQKLSAGDAAGAVEAENEILKILPGDAVHFYDLSLAEDSLKDFAAEQVALKRAVELRPDFALAYNQLGYLAIHDNDQTAAEGYFRKAIASAPQYAEAESNLGSLLAREGKDAEAEQYFRAAVAANPRYTDAWINLAASLAARSMFTEAREAVQNALRVEPANLDAVQLLAMLPAAQPAPNRK
jgi:tetratricopeptide (TPR) repeat protein